MSILNFRGQYFFLSNFYHSPIEYEGEWYDTVEHFYQAMKATNERDHELIRNAKSPGLAKVLARSIELREKWDLIRDDIMLIGLQLKFAPGTDLLELLVATGDDDLIEGNTWGDRYWGTDPTGKTGKNMLGKLLMRIRESASSLWF